MGSTTYPFLEPRPAMSLLPADGPTVAPLLTAGLLLAALSELDRLDLPHPTAAAVLAATGASRSRAYELRSGLLESLPTLLRPPGRPPAPPPPVVDASVVMREAFDFVLAHPGAVLFTASRRSYAAIYRHHVLDLVERHAALGFAALADAVRVPLPTLMDWIAEPPQAGTAPTEPGTAPAEPAVQDPTGPRIESIVDAWRRWAGAFAPFCVFVRDGLAIPYGDTLIGRILATHAGRRPRRRGGRSADEKATRGALQRFFAGAQWIADGSPIGITINDATFTFNWELDVDVVSGAFVGASVRDEEDGRGVVEAFEDGVATTGARPLALSTDNRAPNHTPEVAEALGDTLHIRATRGRPQNDAPVEGAFGLFRQTAPPLVVTGATDRELARAVLALFLTVWCRATNHRPRNDRRGRTRVQLYRGEQPSEAQILAAKAALAERCRLQDLAFRTRQARLDPVVRALLDAAFVRLGLEDPTGNIRDAIARYPHDSVLAGIATFEGKRAAGTLPPTAGARYLLGIVRNIALRDEGLAIAAALLRARLDARDRAVALLDDECRATTGTPDERMRTFLARAVASDGPLRRGFWLRAAGDLFLAEPSERHAELLRRAARHIEANFRVDPRERQAIFRALAAHVLPIA